MRSYAQVYNASKRQVLDEKKALYDTQKVAVIKVLKENYMITGKITDLPEEEQKVFAQRLMEYWSPKTGINKAGQRLLAENMIALTPSSKKEDIKLYIEKQTRKHLDAITNAYRTNNISGIVESFKSDIEPMVQKTINESFILNTVWGIVGDRIKFGK